MHARFLGPVATVRSALEIRVVIRMGLNSLVPNSSCLTVDPNQTSSQARAGPDDLPPTGPGKQASSASPQVFSLCRGDLSCTGLRSFYALQCGEQVEKWDRERHGQVAQSSCHAWPTAGRWHVVVDSSQSAAFGPPRFRPNLPCSMPQTRAAEGMERGLRIGDWTIVDFIRRADGKVSLLLRRATGP